MLESILSTGSPRGRALLLVVVAVGFAGCSDAGASRATDTAGARTQEHRARPRRPVAQPHRPHRRHVKPSPPARLIWHSEFSGPAGAAPDPGQWEEDSGDWTSHDGELEYYVSGSRAVRLNGAGDLAITAERKPFVSRAGQTWEYTSGRIDTYTHFTAKYGRIEARIKMPAGIGLWPAFWALSDNVYKVGWPTAGEIDMVEYLGSSPDRLYSAVHGPGGANGQGLQSVNSRATRSPLSSAFHTYGMEWSGSKIIFTFDGKPYAEDTRQRFGARSWVFDKPFFLILNLAVGGNWGGPPGATTPFPATMLIDWVRVYS